MFLKKDAIANFEWYSNNFALSIFLVTMPRQQ